MAYSSYVEHKYKKYNLIVEANERKRKEEERKKALVKLPTKFNDVPNNVNKGVHAVNYSNPRLPSYRKPSNVGLQHKILPQGMDRPSNPAAGAVVNFANTASLGLLEANNNSIQQLHQQSPISSTVGSMAGYALPFGAGSKLVKPITSKIARPLLKRVTEGAIVGSGVELASGIIGKRGVEQTAKNVGYGAALGGIGDVALHGAGKLIGNKIKSIKSRPQDIQNAFNKKFGKLHNLKAVKPETVKIEPVKVKTPNLKGKFTIKDTAQIKAQQEYNDAIETIQNHFMTNKLIPEEVARIKPELGIDLETLTNNLNNTTNIKQIASNSRLKRVSGIDNSKLRPLQHPLKTTTNTLNNLDTNIPKQTNNVPKSDMTSVAMPMKANQPSKITNIKRPGESTLKPTKKIKKFIAPTDINGNPLSNPKVVSSKKNKTTINQKWDKFYTAAVDNNNPTAKFSKVANDDTFTLATNSASHKDVSNNIINEGMVNKEGIKTGKSLKELFKDMPQDKGVKMSDDASFESYLMDKHNISRQGQGKPVKPNDSVEASMKKVLAAERLHPGWNVKAKELTKWLSDFMDEWSVKAGTIDEGLYNANKKMYPDYIPTNREYSSLELLTKGRGSSGYANQTIPIKKATGSARDIIDPRETIADMVERTVKSAKKNEVVQSIVKSLRKQPEKLKGFAEIVGEPKGNAANVIRVLEKGKPTYVQINDEALLKNILGLNKTIAGSAERTLRKVMNVPKALITHKNPIFAFRNFFRDLPTAYTYGSEKNPIKFGKNFLTAYKDIATNSDIYKQFKGVGAQGGNFFDNGDSAKSIKKLLTDDNWLMKRLKDVPKGIESFNNITESAPRLAEFKVVLKKTGDLQKALFAAKDVTTNFARQGNFTKHVDSGVMYLNAGVQGLDKMAREFKHNPLPTIGKGLVGITAPTLVVNKMNEGNPNYKALTNRQKDSYFNFPNPSDGGKTFIKIPKSRELGVIFSTLEQRFAKLSRKEKNAFKGFGNTVATNFAPANPIENNLIAPALINIPKNKDFADRAIVPMGMEMDNRSPNLQYDERTTELSKWFGDKMKNVPGISDTLKSPKKLDYLMRSYLGVLAQLGTPLMTKSLDKSKTPLSKLGDTLQRQFIADPTFSNQTVTDFYDNFDKIKQKASDNNIINNIPSKTVTEQEALKGIFNKASREMSKINKLIKTATSDAEVKRLKKQIIDIANSTNKILK